MAAAKLSPETTLGSLRYTQEAIESAKLKASKEAYPFLEKATPNTKIKELGFFRGRGCDQCAGSGLKGRQGVYEVMAMTPALRKLILMNVGAQEIKDAAVEAGMLSLRMDGFLKVMKGITTMEQVIRETGAW
jgi:type IV pilus assembly protein PilB